MAKVNAVGIRGRKREKGGDRGSKSTSQVIELGIPGRETDSPMATYSRVLPF